MSDTLPDDPEMLKAMLLAERCESERLRQIIKELQRHRFGRRAETLPEDQMLLGLEDVEQATAYSEAAQDVSAPEGREARARYNHEQWLKIDLAGWGSPFGTLSQAKEACAAMLGHLTR